MEECADEVAGEREVRQFYIMMKKLFEIRLEKMVWVYL